MAALGQLRQAPSLHPTSLGDEPFGKGKALQGCCRHCRKEPAGSRGVEPVLRQAEVLTGRLS